MWSFSRTVADVTDLLLATAALVDIASVSHNETEIANHIEGRLRAVSWLTVTRVGDNVVARTSLSRPSRLILAGHTDTVPVNGNAAARIENRAKGDLLHGLGSADMKSGLAVFLELAETVAEPVMDLTFVFYVCEEVAAVHNGLKALLATHPELLQGDAAILGEPTNSIIEAGCQGTMRLELVLGGARSHTARPWMGRNAIHRLADVLARIDAEPGRQPTIDGCTYREALQAVKVEGGVSGNVVPDRASVLINHRFAPDRDGAAAEAYVRSVIGETVLSDDASLTVVDLSEGAGPGLTHPLLAQLLDLVGVAPVAKLGWTDVAFFAAHGVPAVNFGPGDPTVAHTAGEFVPRADIDRAFAVLHALVTGASSLS
jgi:succinyl-diaminopimelate desuccinylase